MACQSFAFDSIHSYFFVSRTDDYELLASEIVDKTSADVAEYYPVFQEKWHTLTGSSGMLFFIPYSHIIPTRI